MLRVIAGEQRGRRLRVPGGLRVRPALARVKASLFDILVSRGLIEGADILDLFAGSGSLGIEALSRGASSVVFVERDGAAARALRANLVATGVDSRAELLACSVGRAVARLIDEGRAFDGVFVDPPYGTAWADAALPELGTGELVRAGGWVAVHHQRRKPPGATYGCLAAAVRRTIGDAALTVYRRSAIG
jgi:16S rRNA (guanine(966)-N(2))-methyltransferase RsmD